LMASEAVRLQGLDLIQILVLEVLVLILILVLEILVLEVLGLIQIPVLELSRPETETKAAAMDLSATSSGLSGCHRPALAGLLRKLLLLRLLS